jgi:nicotinamidase/pyrazinamidase
MADPQLTVGPGDALLVVDVQNDFLPGGRLAVPAGDEVVPVLNQYLALWRGHGLPVFASRDWHPPDHASFHARGGPWPPHCLAESEGAAFPPDLALPPSAVVVSKADRPDLEAYSAFEGTDLDARLGAAGVRRLFVGGLATDYCVRATVRDALARGYATVVLADAVRAVDVRPGDGEAALDEMSRLGAVLVRREALAA